MNDKQRQKLIEKREKAINGNLKCIKCNRVSGVPYRHKISLVVGYITLHKVVVENGNTAYVCGDCI